MTAAELHELIWKWYIRIAWIPSWGWHDDPVLQGIDEETYLVLRELNWAE